MNTQMGSALPTEKLDKTNFASWEYKMHQYLFGQGYWSYVEGANESTQPRTCRPSSLGTSNELSALLSRIMRR